MERSGQFVTPFDFVGRLPLRQAIPLGLQHVLAMFVGNLTPILIITNLCAATSGAEDFAAIQVVLLQNAMLVAGLVTLVQLFAIGPVGGKVPIIMGTSSGFIGVFQSVVNVMGGGIVAYGAIMGASILGGLFETVLGAFLKPLRRFFPAVVTGTVVLSIGLSLISVGVGSFGGGTSAKDYGSVENLLIALAVMIIVLALKHGAKGLASSSCILIGIVCGYIICAMLIFRIRMVRQKHMRCEEELSFREIAERLSIQEAAARKRFERAKKALQKKKGDICYETRLFSV